MRLFAMIFPAFWTGLTGKAITGAGKPARILATYLMTCAHANMLGLYRLPLLYAQAEAGLTLKELRAAYASLEAIGFAHYDETTETVWVIEMARFQLGLMPGESLKETDYRRKGTAKLYKQAPASPFLGPFFDRYSEILGLPLRRDFLSESKPLTSPVEGPSKPLHMGYVPVPVPVPDPDRKGDTGETCADPDQGFSQFWNAYPKKTDKEKARKAWAKLKPTAELLETILTALDLHKQSGDWQKNGGQFIPYPATWLNGRRWEDEGITALASSLTCDKRVERGQRLLPCGKPAAPDSRPDEPRCLEHVGAIAERNGHAAH